MRCAARVKLVLIPAMFVFGEMSAMAQPFAPLEAWKTAIVNGDRAALSKLYSADANLVTVTRSGNARLALNDESSFWSGMKAGGITEFNPRVLEVSATKGGTRLVLLISMTSGSLHQSAGMRQEWAQRSDGWKMVASVRGPFGEEPVRTLPQPATPNVNLYSDPRLARAELNAALAKAAKTGKRVLAVFGGNWCYDCHVLDATFRSAEFAPLVEANYVVVHINIGDEGKDNGDLALQCGVAIDKGVPSLAVLDPDGKLVYAQKNGEFESTVKIGPMDVRAFLEKWRRRD
jgi:thioredoxin 1